VLPRAKFKGARSSHSHAPAVRRIYGVVGFGRERVVFTLCLQPAAQREHAALQAAGGG